MESAGIDSKTISKILFNNANNYFMRWFCHDVHKHQG
jgi:hypothetical protein